jgi:adenylate cyclase
VKLAEVLGLQATFDWLLDGVPGAKTPVDIVARLGPELVAAGIPIAWVEAFVRTLHPSVVGRSFGWGPGQAVQVREHSYAYMHSPDFLASPIARVFRTAEPLRARLLEGDRAFAELPALRELAQQGYTDYFGAPLRFMNGEVHGIAFLTREQAGFTDEQLAGIAYVLRPLTRITEIFALARTAVNLLNTYVGRNAGERILAGHIQRGDTDIIRCVIWFSDLRGFTSMADSVAPGELIRTLNELFDCQVTAIELHGGEVLKYMGDGLLAIFPIAGDRARDACAAGLAAADHAFASLVGLNQRRVADGDRALSFGLALHVGDVAYGNIGGAGRLDFTCIGPAVNLAARLEGLSGKTGRALLLSEDFASALAAPSELVGTFELKGLGTQQRVFAPKR